MASIGHSGANEVIPGLLIGNLADAEQPSERITHILTIASELNFKVQTHIQHHIFEVDDHPCANILAILPGACNLLDNILAIPSNVVLVHCVSGVSRSATTILAWFMTRKHMSLHDALIYLKGARPQTKPNPGQGSSHHLKRSANGDFSIALQSMHDSTHLCLLNSVLVESDREAMLFHIGNLRETANQLHKKVDNIENSIGLSGCGLPDQKNSDALMELCATILTFQKGAESQLDDRVAKRTRKSALEKIERLLQNGV